MAEYKEKLINLNGNRKLINACKKVGIQCVNPQGQWNGFGYEKLPMHARITNLSEMRQFNNILNEIEKAPANATTEEQKTEKWINRLAKLTGISVDEATKIANEKLEYNQNRIDFLEEKQDENFSKKREMLINKMKRENPLRAIKNKEHALCILAAHSRHTETDYELKLDEARELRQMGMLEDDDVKDYARMNLKHFN